MTLYLQFISFVPINARDVNEPDPGGDAAWVRKSGCGIGGKAGSKPAPCRNCGETV
jgi:hypothetical protein